MLTQSIVVYEPRMRQGKDGKPRLITGSEEHRRHILARTVEFVRGDVFFDIGSMYNIKGRSPLAQLINIEDDYKLVKWDGLRVLCMEVWIPDEDEIELFHPSDLKSVRN